MTLILDFSDISKMNKTIMVSKPANGGRVEPL